MADTFKTLAQVKPLAATLTDAYTVPASRSSTISTITVCNQSATATAFRISVAVAALADTAKQYIAYDTPIAGNDTISFTIIMMSNVSAQCHNSRIAFFLLTVYL